jgi:hypothetical protein
MSELDLRKAAEAVLAASPVVWRWRDGALEPYAPGEAQKVAEAQVAAALPHILEALAVKIEADVQKWYDEEPDDWERANAYDALQEARRIARLIRVEVEEFLG